MKCMKLFDRALMLAGLLFVSANSLFAQDTIRFQNIGFDEAVAKAKKYNKVVFVDVQMAKPSPANLQADKEVFTADSVVRYFNDHCIAIKMNMTTEEGKKFSPHLAMLMYPAYVFYAGNGDQLDFTNAGTVVKDPAILMNKARSSMAVAKVKNDNKRSITFTESNWKAVLAQAKKEHKLVFVDAYTQWCRPCIMMAKDVFTLDVVADFYNQNFINVSLDMEKGEGPALAKKYAVNAYPSFLYIDGNGKLVSRDGGYQEADKFIDAGKKALGN